MKYNVYKSKAVFFQKITVLSCSLGINKLYNRRENIGLILVFIKQFIRNNYVQIL